jgi:putative acetyltransferase
MSAKDFQVRPAEAVDGDRIAEAHIASIRSLGAKSCNPEIVDDWGAPRSGDVYRRAMERGEIFFVAVEREPGKNDRILGFSSYRFEQGKHRTTVYVRGDAAGNGVGTALFTSAEAAARQHGAREIDVDASLAAVAFYKANGFQELGTGEHTLQSGKRMACVFMRKHFWREPNALILNFKLDPPPNFVTPAATVHND